jgi:hypothetical protein
VWAQTHGAQVIAPNWLQPRIGPYLRRERDKRFYFKLFQAGEQLGGLRRLRLLVRAQKFNVEHVADVTALRASDRDVVVQFYNANSNNEAKYFHEIYGRADLVRPALWDMTKPGYRPVLLPAPHVAVHIRGGDFGTAASAEQLQGGRHNLRLPTTWYAEMIIALRKGLGMEVPVIVYSDCSDSEIVMVLTLPNVTRSTHAESITDMLAMEQADALISSGSGFSRWGCYLGQVPRICYPGQRGVRVIGPLTSEIDLEPEVLNAEDLPMGFVAAVKKRFDEKAAHGT